MSVRIPVYGAAGIVAHALVDDADADLARSFRWNLAHGYVVTNWRRDGVHEGTSLHRLLLGLSKGDPRHGDHIDRDKLNHQRANLRCATRLQNSHNVSSQAGSTSPHRGVSWDTASQKWRAQACVDGRRKYLGAFVNELDAARAAARFRAEHLPFSTEDPALLGAAA